MQELLQSLSPAEIHAVELVKTALDHYNSFDGTGLFRGMERYVVLEGRLQIAAIQGRTLFQFWSILLRKMMWPSPSGERIPEIIPLLSHPEEAEILRVLATETASLVMLARLWHDTDKKAQRSETIEPTPITGIRG